MDDFKDKRVLITGGTRGIGLALAEALLAERAQVLVCGSCQQRVRHLQLQRPALAVCCADVTEAEDIQALKECVASRLGGLDLLVNCAGIQQTLQLVERPDVSLLEREVDINLLGPIRVTDAMLPFLLRSKSAAIVNVTSVLAKTPKQCAPAYCAAKAGLSNWTTALRYQLEAEGIQVLEFIPPLVATRMTAGRQVHTIAPEVVAEACLSGLRGRRSRVAVGKARFAELLARLAPSLLARKLRYS